MNKRAAGILLTALVLLSTGFFLLWRREQPQSPPMVQLCQSSAGAAAAEFREFSATGEESHYWYAVAEYRCFMKAYLYLQDNIGNAEYTWCNTVYGQLVLHPETSQPCAAALADALSLLSEDYTNPNGYLRINELMNELIH